MIDWEQVRVDAAISAMQGILEGGKVGELLELSPYIVAKQSVRMANALVEELKSEKKTDEQLKEELNKAIRGIL